MSIYKSISTSLGPIVATYSYSEVVDFSSPIMFSHHTIYVPVKPRNDMWSFLYPFSYKVWIWVLIIIPIFILSLCVANYRVNLGWGALIGFMLRVAMIDDGQCPLRIFNVSRNRSIKLLAVVWIWACFILVQSYSCNLIAILTRPTLKKPIDSIEDLLAQNDLKWNINLDYGLEYHEYLKASESLRPLYDRAGKPPDGEWAGYPCWHSREEMDSRSFVSICNHYSILLDQAMDFSETGKCSFYTIDETFFTTPSVMAFQVGQLIHTLVIF